MRERFARQAAPAAVLLAAALFACAYVALDFNRLHALRVGSNTGTYLQAALHFVRSGSSFNYGDHLVELAVHDQWMMLALVPFLLVYPHAESVIVIQVLALAATAPLVYLLARQRGAAPGTAALLGVIVLLTPSMQGFAYNEFVPLDFTPALAAALCVAALRGWLWPAVLAATLLCGTKEDVGIFTIWFAALYAMYRDRRMGLSIAGVVAVQLCIFFALDAMHGNRTVHPGYGLSDPFWRQNLAFTAEILAPFAFAPLALGWRVLFAAPLAAELFLAQGWSFPLGQAGNYYTIPFVTAVILAAVVVLSTRPAWAKIAFGCALVMALFFNTTVVHFGRHLFPRDPQYAVAKSWGAIDAPVSFPCEDQSAWVVAASNPQARLDGCDAKGVLVRSRAAWSNEPLGSRAPWTRGPRR